jgi:NADH:ubiquinone oxidoreductase subunit 2 (subunit N)
VVASVVAAFYYLKMIKAMYFDEAIMQNEIVSIPMPTMVVASVIMIFIVCFAQNFAEFFNNMKFVLCI